MSLKFRTINADIFMSASYSGTSLKSPEIPGDWLEFVGGFTDEYFFNKKEIEKLSEKDKEILIKFIGKQRETNK
jgi:hypothetical protein